MATFIADSRCKSVYHLDKMGTLHFLELNIVFCTLVESRGNSGLLQTHVRFRL